MTEAPREDEIRWATPLTTVAGLLAWVEADPLREQAIVLALVELQRANETRAINLSDEERTRVLKRTPKANVLTFKKGRR